MNAQLFKLYVSAPESGMPISQSGAHTLWSNCAKELSNTKDFKVENGEEFLRCHVDSKLYAVAVSKLSDTSLEAAKVVLQTYSCK